MSDHHEPVDAEQIEVVRYVTRNYQGLQGLRLLPWVPVVLLWAGSEAGVLAGRWWLWAFVGSGVAATAASVGLGGWYRRRYGHVARLWDRRRVRLVQLAVVGLVALYVVLWTAGVTGWWPPDVWPALRVLSIEGALLGVLLAAVAWPSRRVARHRFVIAAAIAIVSLVPLGAVGGGASTVHPLSVDGGIFVTLAAYFTLVGIADHHVLARTLGGGAASRTQAAG